MRWRASRLGRISRWLLLVALVAFIATLSLTSLLPELEGAAEAVSHAAAYAALLGAFLALTRTGGRGSGSVTWARASLLALVVMALGAGLEIAQITVGREASIWDAGANAVGVAITLTAWGLWRLRGSRGMSRPRSDRCDIDP